MGRVRRVPGGLESRLRALDEENDRLRAQNSRLRKAVNWLRGTLHHGDDQVHTGTVDEREAWECQRTRAVLGNGHDPCER